MAVGSRSTGHLPDPRLVSCTLKRDSLLKTILLYSPYGDVQQSAVRAMASETIVPSSELFFEDLCSH
ncbi:hypothetical protein TNCV_98681 [Trichonephila clavipes]|nr:hypothetical protein TNCV_98681 [Trichonephila clavipes]